jgi:hypothetical protein
MSLLQFINEKQIEIDGMFYLRRADALELCTMNTQTVLDLAQENTELQKNFTNSVLLTSQLITKFIMEAK